MKKVVLCSFLMLINVSLFLSDAFAQFVSDERAKKVVISLFNERKPDGVKMLTAAEIESENLIYHKGVPTYYIFNVSGNSFVIVSADERINPVLGYSFQSKFDRENTPDCLDWLLGEYKEQIYEVVSGDLKFEHKEITEEWAKYEMSNGQKSNQPTPPLLLSVGPLTTTTWSQGCYYNEQCPGDNSLGTKRCGRVPTGCVATAFSQVLKYHNHPAQGTGSNSYTSSTYGTISANFGTTTYNWAAMPNSLSASTPEVAKLLFHAGVSINMDYTPNSSAAFTTAVRAALVNKFKYASTAQYIYKSSYTNTTWENTIRTELDAQRVVIISGSDPVANAGHAFVADGYQGTNSFHINWGWAGSSDGYFLLTALSPSTYSFNTNVGAIIGIKPLSVPTTCPVVTGLSANTITSSGATLNWAAVNGSSNTYNIKYKSSTSSTWTTVTSTTTSKSISGLSASTAYQFQVQRVCGSSASNYSSSATFTTLPSTTTSSNITITLGTGTGTTNTAPYGTGNTDERTQFIITKSQLVAAGYTSATNFIKSLAFDVSSASSQTMNGFTIRIGHTTASSFSSTSFLNATMTTVYSGNKVATTGWNTHTFTSPFTYNGTGNLLIDICWNNTSSTTNSNVRCTNTPTYQTNYKKINVTSGGACTNNTGTRSYSRPNMKLIFSGALLVKALEEEIEETQKPIEEAAKMSVFPNPTESLATIYFDGPLEKAQIKVFDIMGKLVFSDNLNSNTYQLGVENYIPGIYQIVIQTENENFVKKLIVQRNL
ncbi:MAG: thiol protease/hemagglutinin PrtT [Bacteroidota bacterium]